MSDWNPLRVTMSIYEVEGDNQYFDPGKYIATVKLNSGANIQLDLADPENSGSLYLKDQFDTLRISLKEKTSSQGYGSVSFDAEMFRDHPVTKQWITLSSSSLSDAFKGEVGRDQRGTPRIYLGYDAIPHNEGESRGRVPSKRTKETSQQDRGSHDSRRKRSDRGNMGSGKLVVRQNKSRVVTQREKGSTKTTKVEKQLSGSARGSQLGGSIRMSGTSVPARAEQQQLSASKNRTSARVEQQISASRTGVSVREENLNSSKSRTSSNRVSKRTAQAFGAFGRTSGIVKGGLEHDEVERDLTIKTKSLADKLIKDKSAIQAEENRLIGKLKIFEASNAKLDRDEQEITILKNKAERDLESIKSEAISIQREEAKIQNDLIRELERLEQEHADIEARLEDEQMAASASAGGRITLGSLFIEHEDQINGMKQETQMVLDEIKDAILSNQIPIEESSFDPIFREDMERHALDIIDKEKQRYEIELDIIEMEGDSKGDHVAAEINEASLNYQRSQRDALQKEYNRVTSMYDDLSNDIRRELDDELRELDQLRDYHRRLEDDRDHFRFAIDGLKNDASMTYSLDAGSGPVNKFGKGRADGYVSHDDEIRKKLSECEEAEQARREAEIELDRLYDNWRSKIDRELDAAYVKVSAPSDRSQLKEISSLIIENDKVTRSLNSLLADKERLENLLYLRKTNHRLTSIVSLDHKSLNSRVSSIKKEDRELMDELNKSDNALLNKNTALRELDDKIRVLSRKYADLEAEAQEKKGLISSLRIKHDHIRLEIDRLRGLINEEELGRLDLDIRNKESRLRDLQASVDEAELILSEWREKIILKQRLVKSRTQSRVLLFEPDPNDPVDQYIADYVLSHVTTVPVKKIAHNRYLFGTRNIDIIRNPNGAIKVKMLNGELWDLEQFIDMYHDKELQKLDVLGDNEELVVDEKDDYRYQENVRLRDNGAAPRYYEENSRLGETFQGWDAYTDIGRSSKKTRKSRHY